MCSSKPLSSERVFKSKPRASFKKSPFSANITRGIMAKVVVLSVKEEMHQKGEEGGRPCLDLFPTWQQEERIRKRSRASAAAEHASAEFIRKLLSHLQHIKDVTQE